MAAYLTEKSFLDIDPIPFIADGTADGVLTILGAYKFKVGQEVLLQSTTEEKFVKVYRIPSATSIIVGERSKPINLNNVVDISGFLVTESATISSKKQPRPKITAEHIWRAVFDEEPTIALRTTLVDELGERVTDENPLPITGDISVSVGAGLGTPNFIRTAIATKDTTTAIPIPSGTKVLSFYAINLSKVLFTFDINGFNTNQYKTLKPGNEFHQNEIELNSKTLYVQTSKDNEVVEVLAWTS